MTIHATIRKRRAARKRWQAIREFSIAAAITLATLPFVAAIGAALAITFHN